MFLALALVWTLLYYSISQNQKTKIIYLNSFVAYKPKAKLKPN
jgi:hypothetical protein